MTPQPEPTATNPRDGPADTPDALGAFHPAASRMDAEELPRHAPARKGQTDGRDSAALAAILKCAFELFPEASSGAVYLFRLERLSVRAAQHRDGQAGGAAASREAEGLARMAARSGIVQARADVAMDDDLAAGGRATALSLVAVPLRAAGRTLGAVSLSFAPGRPLNEDAAMLSDRLNQAAAVSIESAWTLEAMRR